MPLRLVSTAFLVVVALAVSQSAQIVGVLLVFALMGLGLALPYVLLATLPGLQRTMPRPGRWMEVFKQVLAFPMYGAAVWLHA